MLLLLACGTTESHLDELIVHVTGGDHVEVSLMSDSYLGLSGSACRWSRGAVLTVDDVPLDRHADVLDCGGLVWSLDDPVASGIDAVSPELAIDGVPVMEIGPVVQEVWTEAQASVTPGETVTVDVFGSVETPTVFSVRASDGSEVPFEQVDGAVTFVMPDVATLYLSSSREASCQAVYCSASASWKREIQPD